MRARQARPMSTCWRSTTFTATLEAASLNIYGKYAGGAAYLAKAIKDRQAKYGKLEATVFAGDNIGASPLANGLFFEEPITLGDEPDERRLRIGGKPRVRQGQGRAASHPERRLPPSRRMHSSPIPVDRSATGRCGQGPIFKYLAANVIVKATGKTLFPAFGIKQFRSNEREDGSASGSSVRCSSPRRPSSPRPASPG